MRKSLFAKHFTVSALLILVSVAFFSSILLAFSIQFFKSDEYKLLSENVDFATLACKEEFAKEDNLYKDSYVVNEPIKQQFWTISNILNADLFYCDRSGKITFYSQGSEDKSKTKDLTALSVSVDLDKESQKAIDGLQKKIVSHNILRELRQTYFYNEAHKSQYKNHEESSTIGGVYEKTRSIIGQPIIIDGNTIGYVFLTKSLDSLNDYIYRVSTTVILTVILILCMSFIIFFLIILQMVKPIKEMTKIAKLYGKGDFSKRLEVDREDELGQLGDAMNAMSQDLQTMESSRRNFTSNVSHELKTPMQTIGGFVDGILDGTIPPSQEKYYLSVVSDEIKRLSRLVRSMLDLSRIETGAMELSQNTFNIATTTVMVVFGFEREIESKNIEITGLKDDAVWVKGDEDLLYQVIYNLMDNAIKFVNEGGYIDISVVPKGNKVDIRIRNSGDGLTKAAMKKIFDRFYKTDRSRSLDTTGVGLGLNIVRTVVHLHDGDISVDSKEGEYTDFTVTLPTTTPPNGKYKKRLKELR